MLSPGKGKIGRNDPCPCGSGKKYKRCCLEQQCATHSFWARQRNASDQLTRDMLRFAERKFGDQIQVAWEDFKMTDLPVPLDAYPGEQQIFMPYFLRSEEHTSELQSRLHLVCRLLLEKKKIPPAALAREL